MAMKVTLKRLAIAVGGVATVIGVLADRGESPTSRDISPLEKERTAYEPYEATRQEFIDGLSQRAGLGTQHADLFAPDSWTPAPPPAAAKVQAPPAPVPPPNPYRFAGALLHDGKLRTFITDGDRVYEVHSGDELNSGYRVEAVTADEVELVYTPLGTRHPIAARWAFSSKPTEFLTTASMAGAPSGYPPSLPPGSPLMAAADEPPLLSVGVSPFPPGSPLTPASSN